MLTPHCGQNATRVWRRAASWAHSQCSLRHLKKTRSRSRTWSFLTWLLFHYLNSRESVSPLAHPQRNFQHVVAAARHADMHAIQLWGHCQLTGEACCFLGQTHVTGSFILQTSFDCEGKILRAIYINHVYLLGSVSIAVHHTRAAPSFKNPKTNFSFEDTASHYTCGFILHIEGPWTKPFIRSKYSFWAVSCVKTRKITSISTHTYTHNQAEAMYTPGIQSIGWMNAYQFTAQGKLTPVRRPYQACLAHSLSGQAVWRAIH